MKGLSGFKAIYLFLKNVAGYFTYFFISFILNRNKKIWIYGSYGGTFRDNSKYFYLYCNKHFPEIKHIWISTSKEITKKLKGLGLNASYKYSLSALYYALKAKVYIFNMYGFTDIYNGNFRGNAFLFNFWHGIPYKKIENDITQGPSLKYRRPRNVAEKLTNFLLMEPLSFRKSSTVLSTSQKLVPIFSSAFQLPEEKIFVGPYPRNSIFNLSPERLINHIKKIEDPALLKTVEGFKKFSKVVIYMPTWRDTHEDFLNIAIPDFNKLNLTCKKHNILFAIKVHPLTSISIDLSKLHNVINLNGDIDIYPLLPLTDALVSDYSSIIFDYSLLKKKIVFYAFDKEDYLKKSREAYFEYEEVFSNHITYTFDDLLNEIELLGNEEANVEYSYPLPASFHENNVELKDIANYIKQRINY